MGVLSDVEIHRLAKEDGFIEPFSPNQVKSAVRLAAGGESVHRLISYGTSSYGYDARLSDEFKVFTDIDCAVMDPKNPDSRAFVDKRAEADGSFLIPPRGYVLSSTVEYFRMPPDVIAVCVGKSTYARSGLHINVTPLEPGWHGNVTLEFSNALPIPLRVYAGEGVCQFLFLRGEGTCRTSYADRAGKYQGQRGVTLPRT